jgi:DNA-binding GntR family transcriptional regulator
MTETEKGKEGTLISRAYSQLKADIICGRLSPREKLRVEHLKRDYDVSSGTLREALTMLMADRLVVAEGQRGFRVRDISPRELIDLNRIRVLLEMEAIRQAVEYGDEEWEAKVVTASHLLTKITRTFAENPEDETLLAQWEQRHREFHLALVEASPSEWLRYFLAMAYQQYERYRHLFLEVVKTTYKGRDPHAEHLEIVEAALARDGDRAAELLKQHVNLSIEEWAEYFTRAGLISSDERDMFIDQIEDKPIGKARGRKPS